METVLLVLADYNISIHKVGDNLLNTVTDWHSYRLENQDKTFNIGMHQRIKQELKKLRVTMDRVRFDVTN